MPEPPSRTRAEALSLARSIAEKARHDPGGFARLAAQYSEDISTSERGGSLGGVSAIHLTQWPEVLDALAVIRPGEASQVVETEYGFHVLYRQPPPQKRTISGSRIVIGHTQAEFLAQLRRETIPLRTREEGLALAQQVRAKAIANPGGFEQLVGEYSEHPDAVVGGDLGEWSTWEPTDYPRQVEALSNLAVGEVSAPLETLFGWEILLRTPKRAREHYGTTLVEVPFDIAEEASGTEASSRAAALARAKELAEILRDQPERFSELQQEGCCQHVVQWPEGRGWPPLMATLKQLRIGQIAVAPVQFGFSYVIAKRVKAMPTPTVAARFDLPASAEPGRK